MLRIARLAPRTCGNMPIDLVWDDLWCWATGRNTTLTPEHIALAVLEFANSIEFEDVDTGAIIGGQCDFYVRDLQKRVAEQQGQVNRYGV